MSEVIDFLNKHIKNGKPLTEKDKRRFEELFGKALKEFHKKES